MQINIALLTVVALGVIADNNSLLFSGLVLLLLRNLQLDSTLDLIDEYSTQLGIFLIMLGVLTPIATGQIKLNRLLDDLWDPLSLLAVGVGILITQFTREGLTLLEAQPAVVVSLVFGIILGVAFFKGVPSGPLIAGGITAVIYQGLAVLF